MAGSSLSPPHVMPARDYCEFFKAGTIALRRWTTWRKIPAFGKTLKHLPEERPLLVPRS
jgi:hypothetical protein